MGFPLKVKFQKINHKGFGNNHKDVLDTLEKKDIKVIEVGYHTSKIVKKPIHEIELTRDCMYRGIHKMICEVWNSNSKVIFREVVFVPIA